MGPEPDLGRSGGGGRESDYLGAHPKMSTGNCCPWLRGGWSGPKLKQTNNSWWWWCFKNLPKTITQFMYKLTKFIYENLQTFIKTLKQLIMLLEVLIRFWFWIRFLLQFRVCQTFQMWFTGQVSNLNQDTLNFLIFSVSLACFGTFTSA